MYWNNPIQKIRWPSDRDPIQESLHDGAHCLYYDPAVDKSQIHKGQTLQNLCDWANNLISANGCKKFLQDPNNHYDIANLVKLNLWVHDLPRRGSIKPMLLKYTGKDLFETGTGESRLRALERIPSIHAVSAFVSTHQCHAARFAHLEKVTSFDQFAQLCAAVTGQEFLFRLTDSAAPFGLDWYEYDSSDTAQVTPGTEYCVTALSNYLAENSNMEFTPQWFDLEINWQL